MFKISQSILLAIIISLIVSCSRKSKVELTMFKSSILESYYLKLSYSDTIYLVNNYPNQNGNYYAVLEEDEKERIGKILDETEFPNVKSRGFKSSTEDSAKFAFLLLKENKISAYRIHSARNENPYWLLADYIDELKQETKFLPFKGKIKIDTKDELFDPLMRQ